MALLSKSSFLSELKASLYGVTDSNKRITANSTYDNLADNLYTTEVSAVTTLGETSTAIPALTVPAGAIIVDAGVVVTTDIAMASGTVGTKIGTAADGAQLSAADIDSIATTGTSVAAGVGTTTVAATTTALAGFATLVIVAGEAYREDKTEVHFTITSSAAATAGAVKCFVKYLLLNPA